MQTPKLTAAIVELAALHKITVDPSTLAALLGTKNPLTPAHIARSLIDFGLVLDVQDTLNLESAVYPAIFYSQSNCRLILRRDRGFVISIPGQGERRVSPRDLTDELTAEAGKDFILISLSLTYAAMKQSEMPYQAAKSRESQELPALAPRIIEVLLFFKRLLVGVHFHYVVILLMGLIGIPLGLLMPKVSAWIFEALKSGATGSTLQGLLLMLASFSVFQLVLGAVGSSMGYFMSRRLPKTATLEVIWHILQLPAASISQLTTSDFFTTLGFSGSGVGVLMGLLPSLMLNFFFLIGLLISIAGLSTPLFWLVLVFLVLMVPFAVVLAVSMTLRQDVLRERSRLAGTVMMSSLSAMPATKACTAEQLVRKKLEKQALDVMDVQNEMTKTNAWVQWLIKTLVSSILCFAMIHLATRVSRNEISFSVVYITLIYFQSLVSNVLQVFPMVSSIVASMRMLKPVVEALNETSDHLASAGKMVLPDPLSGNVRCENLSYRYRSQDRSTLTDVSVHFPQGKVTAIVGPSGCGKSTLLSILGGLLRPTTGRVLLDEIELNSFLPTYLRRQIGYVSQTAPLFSGPVFENVAFSDDRPDLKRVSETLAVADALAFVSELPGQLNYRLAEGGIGISGGERQRLAIAQSLYRDTPILLLDEVTANLDGSTEQAFLARLRGFASQKTTIMIAHRISTIRIADHIVYMDSGKVVAQGTMEHLLATVPEFKRFVSPQFQVFGLEGLAEPSQSVAVPGEALSEIV